MAAMVIGAIRWVDGEWILLSLARELSVSREYAKQRVEISLQIYRRKCFWKICEHMARNWSLFSNFVWLEHFWQGFGI